jgi:hypothetical protein
MNHVTATEEPKVLISKDSVPRFTESLVHLVLLAITAYVLVLNFRNTYWSDTETPYVNTKLEALQFAAKLYEILICASLASTSLHLLRYALWSAEGVSLGSLIASYGFGNVSILLSPAFWAGLIAAMQPRQQPRHFALMIFLVLAIFMAAVAGPSAAIMLIPQLDWWPQSYNASLISSGSQLEFVLLDTSITSLWPPTLNKSYLPNVTCLAPTAVLNPLCPAGGYYDIFDQTRNLNSYFLAIQDPFNLLNISMSGGGESGINFFRSLIVEYAPLTIASTPSQELASSIWESDMALWPNSRVTLTLDGYGLHKPVVQVQCQVQDTAPSLSIQFPHTEFLTPPFPPLDLMNPDNLNFSNIYKGQSWNVSVSSIGNTADLEDHMRNGSLYFAWVDLSQYDPRPSIAAAIFVPSCNSSVPNQIAACSVDAR